MDAILLNQPLEIYGQPLVAICHLPAKTSEALNFLYKGWSSVVILDQNHVPQGLFNARCLLNWRSPQDPLVFAAHAESLEEIDLEPLPAIAHSMTIAEFLQRISQYKHSAETWALVDAYGKFVGVLEVGDFLRSLIQADLLSQPEPYAWLLPLIYQLPLPVKVSDQQGDVVAMNAAWRHKLHSPDLNGLNIGEGVADGAHGLRETSQLEDNLILLSEQPLTHEFCMTNGDASTWQVINVPLQGNLKGLDLAIAYDITAQKNMAKELSGLMRVKDEFLTCVNHELKTPLTSVIGIASLLSNNTFGELNERQSRYIKMIHQSGRQLVSIIDNIFDLAKAESGQLKLYVETISVKDVCQKSIQQVKKLIQQDPTIFRNYQFDSDWDIDIQLEIDPTVKTIYADETRLQQMLVNLLSNAFKFSVLPSEMIDDQPLPSPQIGLTVKWWEGWLALTVWDQGIGIPEEKQCLVFQKFQQVENVLTRRFEGTGSSLLLTRHLARLHGGDITFVSQVDVGSQFTILLPSQAAPTEVASKRSDRGIDLHQNRLVLVVENSIETSDLLRNILTELDYQVVIARSGPEALEKTRRLLPCLILVSPHIPMLSGWDVVAVLKGDPATKFIRVVVIKSSDEPNVAINQADGILLKPIQKEELQLFLPDSVTVPKLLKFLYINDNLEEAAVNLLQELGHCLLEAEDINQADVLSRIWQPDLLLLDGDRPSLLEELETIHQLEFLPKLPILIVTKSVIAEINWLRAKFSNLNLHECQGLDLDNLEARRPEILFALHHSLIDAMHYGELYV